MKNIICILLLLLSINSYGKVINDKEIKSPERLVNFSSGDLLLNAKNCVSICLDPNDMKGVDIAVGNLCTDIHNVCGATVSTSADASSRIIIGTIGHSRAIDLLIKQGKIDGRMLRGKREKYIITSIGNQLIIAGSDRRGSIYGVYQLSQQIGVSPWYWWADVPVDHHDRIYINEGVYSEGEPAVRYRGIFLNDEAPCLTSWVKNTYGTDFGDHRFYSRVFELLLRLKANFIWPAMWGWAFYANDSLNSKTADDMGIIVGTSHHEPMCRSQKEWHNHTDNPNVEPQDAKLRADVGGAWDYTTNKANLDAFWAGGVARNKNTEDLITIGMRGDGDMPMSNDKNIGLLQDIIKNQRKIIEQQRGKKAKDVPQVWALYKEVMDYYDAGMKVPDDVTLLLCDDNWGDVRRVPKAADRNRKGGWGLYYHVDYVGAPRNSKWINVTPTQNMWEQLTLAYDYGIDRLWILNVGDLKPMEYPIQMFMDMAWNPKQYRADNITDHTRKFCSEQFGESNADEAARLLNLCCKMNGRCTAEMLTSRTYNIHTGEWSEVVNQYTKLENEALRLFINLKPEQRDAYREIILFPIQAMGNLHYMYYAKAMNDSLYQAGNPDANKWADECKNAFHRDSLLCYQYNHDIAGGKWNGMMTQKHIGYRMWADMFPHDMMPKVNYISMGGKDGGYVFAGDKGFVSIEAEHYFDKHDGKAKWTVIPYMGRTLSGIAMMPYTDDVKGGSLTYRFRTNKSGIATVKAHIIVKSTLDFLDCGGLKYNVSLDGGAPITVNFNKDMNEKPQNINTKYYPVVVGRVVESVVDLPISNTTGDVHSFTISPLDPGIVIEKIVIDWGGYQPSYLFGNESAKTLSLL